MTSHSTETQHPADNLDRLVMMANQIAQFFTSFSHDEAVRGVAAHINQFWDPRMRRRFLAAAEERRGQLHQLVVEAIPHVKG
ncbi:MAG: formate dehydrogenase subunit delta [Alsobacter sp.]